MKKTLLLLALCALAAGCSPGGKIAELQKENDSLKSVLGKEHHSEDLKWTRKIGKTVAFSSSTLPSNDFNSYLVHTDFADTGINRWDTVITSKNSGRLNRDTSCRAFIIPMSNMQMLLNYNCNYCIFYLAMNSSGGLSLMYQGGISFSADSLSLITFARPNDTAACVLDNTLPCPVCPANGLLGNILF